jgi:hypothetical protein
MSRTSHILVSRDYRPSPDACTRALQILLNQPVMKKAAKGSQPSGPDNAEDLEHDRIAYSDYNK